MARIEIKDPLLYVEDAGGGGFADDTHGSNIFFSSHKFTAYVGLYPIFTRHYLDKYDAEFFSAEFIAKFDGLASDAEDARDEFDKAFAERFRSVFGEKG